MAITATYIVPHPPLIIPEVGNENEKKIKKTSEAYDCIAQEIANIKPETIIISSPHATMCSNYFHISSGNGAQGSFFQFGAPQVHFEEKYDDELITIIENIAITESFPAGTQNEGTKDLDHGTMVPLYFIRKFYKDFRLVRIGLAGLSLEYHYHFGQIVKHAVKKAERSAVYIASGDLSHKLQSYGPYGFTTEGPQYDKKIVEVCSKADFGKLLDFDEDFCERAAECGHRSFVIMAGALDGLSVKAKWLSYEDITGVGYGVCTFHITGKDKERKFLEKRKKIEKERNSQLEDDTCDLYVKLAKKSIENYVRDGEIISIPSDLPAKLAKERAGAFVSIHKEGQLRGCIGTIAPTRNNLAEEIIYNAISASSKDPRFSPITPDELSKLNINVDVLGVPQDVKSESDLDVKRYGIIVTTGEKRGVLLPDLRGVDTVKQQISIARQKAGISPDEDISLQRFEVVRHA